MLKLNYNKAHFCPSFSHSTNKGTSRVNNSNSVDSKKNPESATCCNLETLAAWCHRSQGDIDMRSGNKQGTDQ